MKRIALILTLLGFTSLIKAQKKQNIYFFTNDGKEVQSRDSADFVRVIQEPESENANFPLLEDYMNGKPKTRGEVSAFEPRLVYEGQTLRYRKSGGKESLTNYKNGYPVHHRLFYFGDGKVNMILDYDSVNTVVSTPAVIPDSRMSPYRLVYYADSVDGVMVENGNGYFKQKLKPGESGIVEEGTVVGGFKEGNWSGTGASVDFSFKEKYLKGKLISGESVKSGKSYTYTFAEEVPAFEGGMGGFYTYVQKSIRYPEDAFKQRITGRVSVSFVVEADGSLSEFKVVKSVSPSLDKEALRIMKGSPKWIPGKQKGIPVRTMLNMPFTFSLNR